MTAALEERELRDNLAKSEETCETASRLCQTLLGCADLTTDYRRYRELEAAMAQLVRANEEHARALAELGDYLLARASFNE